MEIENTDETNPAPYVLVFCLLVPRFDRDCSADHMRLGFLDEDGAWHLTGGLDRQVIGWAPLPEIPEWAEEQIGLVV